MGFLDKLLGRTKQVAEKGVDVAEKAKDTAEDKLGMHDHDHGDAPEAPPTPEAPPSPGQSA